MINAAGLNTTLDITGQLFAKNQILSAERARRAQERDDQPQEVPGYSDDRSRQVQHAFIMPESARGCRLWTREQPRRELLRTTLNTRPVASGYLSGIRTRQTTRHCQAATSGCFRLERSPGGACTHWKSAALSRRTPTAAVPRSCREWSFHGAIDPCSKSVAPLQLQSSFIISSTRNLPYPFGKRIRTTWQVQDA